MVTVTGASQQSPEWQCPTLDSCLVLLYLSVPSHWSRLILLGNLGT